jgi:hypothetical protein
MGATEHAVTRSHTTERGCVVTVHAVGPSVEIVVRQPPQHWSWCATVQPPSLTRACDCGAGSVATYTCSHDDGVAIGTMIIAACPRPSAESDDD